LNSQAACLRLLELNLSVDERARVARFRFTQDRERFIVARALLREILALYLSMAARQLRFGYSAHGKPFLMYPAHKRLRFNVSHSRNIVLVAIAYEREIGVDIEHINADYEYEAIAQTVLSTPEKHVLDRFDGEAKRRAFIQFWTRKEAYIKADGRGVTLPLEHIDTSVPADRVAILDEATGERQVCERWMLRNLAAGPDYAATLATEGRNWQLACWQWSE